MKRYGYVDQNFHLPRRTFAWFFGVRTPRLLRQMALTNPERLAVLYAEVHAKRGLLPW